MFTQVDDPEAVGGELPLQERRTAICRGNIQRQWARGHAPTTSRSRRCSSTCSTTAAATTRWPRRRCCKILEETRRGHPRARLEGDRHVGAVRQRSADRQPVAARADRRADRSTRWFPLQHAGRQRSSPASRMPQPDADPYDRPLAHDRRRARRHGLLRRRADPVGAGPARRQPGPRQVVSAAPVRLGASRDADPALRARRADGRPGAAAHPVARHQHAARSCRRSSPNSSASARRAAHS